MSFAALGLSGSLAATLASLGYEHPTPIQAQAIPAALAGRDIWGSAATGSGKTAAFVLPVLEILASSRSDIALARGSRIAPVRALFLMPTRELALQVAADVERMDEGVLKTCVLIGGVSENPQRLALRGGADIVIATPGRLLDLIRTHALTLAFVKTVVLDEADRLLSLGFGEELAALQALLPPERQTMLFSATFPHEVKHLADALLTNPVRIEIPNDGSVENGSHLLSTLTQRAIETDVGKRTQLLRHLLGQEGWSQVLVFSASRQGSEHVANKLRRADIAAIALHGDLAQGRRSQALLDLREKRIQVLVATDVVARGIDIPGLPVVVNYDLPRSPATYLHRVGRTARAGETGLAVSLLTVENDAHFRLIEKRHKFKVDRETIEGFERTEHLRADVDPHGGVKGKRPNKKDKLRMKQKSEA